MWFVSVASRIAQKATLKAENAGEATVDLEAAKRNVSGNTNTGSAGTGNDGSEGGTALD